MKIRTRHLLLAVFLVSGSLEGPGCGRAGGVDGKPVPSAADLIPTDLVDDEGSPGGSASLRFDQLGRPHISYYENNLGALKYVHFVQTSDFGGKWLPETSRPLLDVGGLPTGESISSVGQEIEAASDPNRSEGMGSFSRLMIDSSDRPHIVYYDDENQKLKLAWGASEDRTSGRWTFNIVFLESGSVGVGKWPSATLDHANVLHTAYFDEMNKTLKYLRWDRGADRWNPDTDGDSPDIPTEVVDTVGEGMQSSVVVTPPDVLSGPNRVYIVYYTAADGNLRLASRPLGDQAGWTIEVLDDLPPREKQTPGDDVPDDVGRWPAAAVDKRGNLHICYYDDTNKDLKYLLHDVERQKSFPRFKRLNDYSNRLTLTKEEHHQFDSEGQVVGIQQTDIRPAEPLTFTVAGKTSGVEVVREWVGAIVDDGTNVGTGFEADLALGPDDIPIISYRDATNGDLKIAMMEWDATILADLTQFHGYTGDVHWKIAALDTPLIKGVWSSIDTFPGLTPSQWRIGVAYEGFERTQGVELTRRLLFLLVSPETLKLY